MATQSSLQAERAQVLDDWARYTAERLKKSLQKKRIGHSGDLENSLLYALKGTAGGDVTSIEHTFNYYGKFVDMGVGKGQKIEDVKENGDLISLLGGGRKPKKWFSKRYHFEVNKLELIMAEKFGEQGQRVIIETITGQSI